LPRQNNFVPCVEEIRNSLNQLQTSEKTKFPEKLEIFENFDNRAFNVFYQNFPQYKDPKVILLSFFCSCINHFDWNV
jgi:hypothetical protein